MKQLWILFTIFLLAGTKAIASPILISDQQRHLELWHEAEFLVDQSEQLSFDQVKALPVEKWQKNYKLQPALTFPNAPIWMKFKLANKSSFKDFVLFLDVFYSSHLDLFLERSNGVQQSIYSGVNRKFSPHEIPYYGFAFPIHVDDGEEISVFVRSLAKFPVRLEFHLQESQAFFSELRTSDLLFGMYFGIIGVLAIVNLFVFLVWRHRAYLYYVMSICGLHLFTNLSQFGVLRSYVFRDWVWLNSKAFYLDYPFTFGPVTFFTLSFLEIRKHNPRLAKGLGQCLGFVILFALTGIIFESPINEALSQITAFVYVTLLLATCYMGIRRAHRQSTLFTISWLCLIIFWVINLLRIDGYIDPQVRTDYLILFGAVIEGTLLSLALADRLRTLSREKEVAEKRAFEADTQAKIAAQVSHDIRSPLSALNIALSTVSLPADKQKVISLASQRINNIANGLLRFSQRRTPQDHANLIASVVEDLLEEKRMQYRARTNISFEAHLSAAYGLITHINPSELSRSLSNLIDNAVEAIGDRTGRITVELQATSNDVTILISDTGIGIPADVLPRLGEKGFSFGKAGFGLGLHTAKQTILNAGGKLLIQSTPDVGTTVTLTFPLET